MIAKDRPKCEKPRSRRCRKSSIDAIMPSAVYASPVARARMPVATVTAPPRVRPDQALGPAIAGFRAPSLADLRDAELVHHLHHEGALSAMALPARLGVQPELGVVEDLLGG